MRFLLNRDPDELPRIVFHPEQVAATSYIAQLLDELRGAGNNTDAWYDFEARLLRARYRADEARGRAARALKRTRSLKTPDWSTSSTDPDAAGFIAPSWRIACETGSREVAEWELEELVAERISRQLATVGDALAWRVFRYDRRVIVALSTNQPSGPFVGRDGLPYEVGAILQRRERGNFSLLHDLTSVIRHVDITEVHPNGFRELHEIKASRTTSGSRQLRAGQAALDAATGTAPLPVGSRDRYLHRVRTSFRTTVRDLAQPIATARRDGIYLGYHGDRVVTIFDTRRVANHGLEQTWEEHLAAHESLLAQRWPGSPVFRAYSGDRAARDPGAVPYGLYPLPTPDCADLICDHLLIVASISFAALEHALERPDAQVHMIERPATARNLDGDIKVLELRRANRGLGIPMGAVSQLLLEFIDTSRWAAAAWELLDTGDKTHNVLTFTNERAELR